MTQKQLFSIVALYISAVFYLASTTPISPHEANIFYTYSDIVSTMMHWGDRLVGGFLGLRIFFLFFGFLSVILFYELSRRHYKKREDAYVATTIFMLLPGILTAMTLANVAIIVVPLVLFFVLMYEQKRYIFLPFVMLALFFIHEASFIFFAALLLYGVVHKDKKLAISASAFLIAFLYLAKGIEIGGIPSGHFVEIFGLYATVFSPLLFLYFFYAMYRILLREKKTLLWYISFTALLFSLVLSIRQRVYITDFAPYVMLSVLLMLDVYNHSVRVRLPEFQRRYKRGFKVVMTVLSLSVLIIVFHQFSYYMMKNPSTHFASRIYAPYEFTKELKKEGVNCYDDVSGRVKYQFIYYGIPSCVK